MKKIRKWIIVSKDGKFVCANNQYNYTNNIDDACVWYNRSEAVREKTESCEKVMEVETKNRIIQPIKSKSQADIIEKLLKKARKK
jgi:hypothetical protein